MHVAGRTCMDGDTMVRHNELRVIDKRSENVEFEFEEPHLMHCYKDCRCPDPHTTTYTSTTQVERCYTLCE